MGACGVVAAAYHLGSHKGAHPVVYAHGSRGVIGDGGESVARRGKARVASVYHRVGDAEGVLAAQVVPVLLLVVWEYEYNLHRGIALMKTADGAHQYGHSLDG